MLANGRFAMGERLKPLLEAARDAGLLAFDDSEEAFRIFFGLVGRDVQIRLLLGERLPMTAASIDREAGQAARQFLALFGSSRASFEAPLRGAPQDEDRLRKPPSSRGAGAAHQDEDRLRNSSSSRGAGAAHQDERRLRKPPSS
jgi:hypothetical protein